MKMSFESGKSSCSCFIGRRTYSYSEPQLYNQNSGGNYFDTQGGSAQVSAVVTNHSMANNGNGNGALAMGLSGGQIISSSGAYLIGGNSMDGSAPHTAAQTTRASPATVSSNHVTAFEPHVMFRLFQPQIFLFPNLLTLQKVTFRTHYIVSF